MKLRLTISGAGEDRVEELDASGSSLKVGRLSSSHLKFEDPSVSRIHAMIECRNDTLNVVDLGSASGTFVNGEKVTKREIQPGDEVRFGDVSAIIEVVDETTAAEFAAAESTVVTTELGGKLKGDRRVDDAFASLPGQSAVAPESQASVPASFEDCEPFTLQGYYDDSGNYIPGYYDEKGNYHHGYGYYDDAGIWAVAYGYYDPDGEWIETEAPEGVTFAAPPKPSEADYYTEVFFGDKGGDVLEVAMIWGDQVLSVTSYSRPRSVMIGSEKGVDFVVEHESVPGAAFPLVSYDGSGYFLTVTRGMSGLINFEGEQHTLEDAIASGLASSSPEAQGAHAIRLGPRSGGRIEVGEVTFLVHFTDLPVLVGGAIGLDLVPVPFQVISAVAHLSFLLLALTMPEDPNGLELESLRAQDRFVQLMVKPEQEEEEEILKKEDDAGEDEPAAKHSGEEGKAGKKDETATDKKMAMKGPSDNANPQIKRAYDTEVASSSGVFSDGAEVASLFGTADTTIGSDAIHAIGNLQGDAAGAAYGEGGLGLASGGRGGGGNNDLGFGMSDVGTKGRIGGGGGGGGNSYGKNAATIKDKKTKVPKIVPGRPRVQGSLDKEIIRRVVRQHRNEIRYCYEKQLQKNPKLSGEVKVKFIISGTGSVMSAVVSDSTLKNSKVQQCMTKKIRRWVFPEPKGGGTVIVNYPFKFST